MVDKSALSQGSRNQPFTSAGAGQMTPAGPVLSFFISAMMKTAPGPSILARSDTDVAARLDHNLSELFSDYADLRQMLGINPIAVTLLETGAFQRYQHLKQEQGFDLAHLKPPHMNPSDQVLADLLNHR